MPKVVLFLTLANLCVVSNTDMVVNFTKSYF